MNGYTYFRSYKEAIRTLPDDMRLAIRDAMDDYMFDDIEPEFENPVCKSFFELMRPTLDKSKNRGESGKTESKQGQTKSKRNQTKSKQNQTESNENQSQKMTSEDKDKEKDKEKDKGEGVIKNNTRKRVYDSSPELDEAVRNFVAHRRAMRKPMTDHAVDLFIKRVKELDASIPGQVRLIETAIERGWQTVYPPNDGKSKLNPYQAIQDFLQEGQNDETGIFDVGGGNEVVVQSKQLPSNQ